MNLEDVDAAIRAEEENLEESELEITLVEKDWFPAVDRMMNAADALLDVLWCMNVAGVALRPIVYVCASDAFYDALYGQPISTFISTLRFLLVPSFWIYIIENYQLWKAVFITLVALLLLRKILDFSEDGVIALRWWNRRATLRMVW